MRGGSATSLRGGDKALVGSSAYRRYLKTPDDKRERRQAGRRGADMTALRFATNAPRRAARPCHRPNCSRWRNIFGRREISTPADLHRRSIMATYSPPQLAWQSPEDRLPAARLKPSGACAPRAHPSGSIKRGKPLRSTRTGHRRVGRVFRALGIALPLTSARLMWPRRLTAPAARWCSNGVPACNTAGGRLLGRRKFAQGINLAIGGSR